jgi:hypothetical protein
MADTVFVLTTNDHDEAEAAVYPTYEQAQAALVRWCRDRWDEEMADEGASWPHGAPPRDDGELLKKVREWAYDNELAWHLYRDVPLP